VTFTSPTPIEALAAIIEHGEAPVLATRLIARFGDVVQLFAARRWLQHGPEATVVSCRLCDEGHPADVQFERAGRRYWCVNSGAWCEVDHFELETLTPSLKAILISLREALAPIAFQLHEAAPNLLWRLGESNRCGLTWTALVARRVSTDKHAAILAALPRIAAKPSLVFTATPPPLAECEGVHFTALASAADLGVDGVLRFSDVAIRSGLGTECARRQGRGRPADFEQEALAVIAAATREELERDDEGLMELVCARVPGLKSKSHGVIAMSLKRQVISAAKERRAHLGIRG
jgi:hypothetical protein